MSWFLNKFFLISEIVYLKNCKGNGSKWSVMGELVNHEDVNSPQVNVLHDLVQLLFIRVTGMNSVLGLLSVRIAAAHLTRRLITRQIGLGHVKILIIELVRLLVGFDREDLIHCGRCLWKMYCTVY